MGISLYPFLNSLWPASLGPWYISGSLQGGSRVPWPRPSDPPPWPGLCSGQLSDCSSSSTENRSGCAVSGVSGSQPGALSHGEAHALQQYNITLYRYRKCTCTYICIQFNTENIGNSYHLERYKIQLFNISKISNKLTYNVYSVIFLFF